MESSAAAQVVTPADVRMEVKTETEIAVLMAVKATAGKTRR
jgi:hypothetical protein